MLTDKERAFLDELYQKYYKILLLSSFVLLGKQKEHWETAEDCVQETFVKAMIKMHKLYCHTAPELWLKKTCRNITLSKRRKQYNRARILGFPSPMQGAEEIKDVKNDIAEWIIREELLEKKQQLLETLTQQEQQVYRNIYEGRQTIKEAAEALQITEGSVRGALQRIKKKITKIMMHIVVFKY